MSKKFLPIIVILIILIPASWQLLGPGYFSMHDDLQVLRIFEMEKCFNDGQIPCRWSPDIAYGYGQPMFNYYSAFPYYLGVLIRMLSPLSIIGTVKGLFLLVLVASVIGMYVLVKEFWGKACGVVAAILYVYAPYRALDIYVRGALSESFALAILPFLWLSMYLLIKKPNFKNVVFAIFSLAALLTTHNVSILMYTPFTLLWIGFWIVKEKRWAGLKNLTVAGIFGLGLASFFILPVVFERSLIQTEFFTIDYLSYIAHFVSLKQLFVDRSWGYGPSIFGPTDDLSFQIGWPHWWLAILAGLLALTWLMKKKDKTDSLLVLMLVGCGLFSAFLSHLKSQFIWQNIPFIEFVQFPWRFLGLTSFFLSFAGAVIFRPKFILRKIGILFVVLITILLNWTYFKPERVYENLTDAKKLSGEDFVIQQKSAILDYLPITSPDAPKELAPENPQVVYGEGETYNFSKRSNSFFFDAEVFSQNAEIEIPVLHFPNWRVIEGGEIIPSYPSGKYGAITIKLLEGRHIIQGRFENTPIRALGHAITLITASVLFIGIILKHNKKKFLWL